jgi:hypothetical protein
LVAFFGLESTHKLLKDEGPLGPFYLEKNEFLDIRNGDPIQNQDLIETVVVGDVRAEASAVLGSEVLAELKFDVCG